MKYSDALRYTLIAVAWLAIIVAIGCKDYRSFWVNVTVVNHTAAPIREIEVDYPSASFGINQLAAGATYHYRLKVSGQGKIHAQYPGALDKPIRVDGPMLQENDQGQILIALESGNQIRFTQTLSMGH